MPPSRIGHIQIAGVPGRHEPDVGEIHYPYLFRLLDELRYDGWIGCEYRPQATTVAGLHWFYRLIDRPVTCRRPPTGRPDRFRYAVSVSAGTVTPIASCMGGR